MVSIRFAQDWGDDKRLVVMILCALFVGGGGGPLIGNLGKIVLAFRGK